MQHLARGADRRRRRALRSPPPLLIALALAGAAVAASGCSAETGILVAVSGSSVSSLEFYVAVKSGNDYVIDERASGLVADVNGRNLRARPYELLITERDAGAAAAAAGATAAEVEVRVLALAYRTGSSGSRSLYGYALTNPPQKIIPDEVVRRPITIAPLSSSVGISPLGTSCFRVRQGKDTFNVVARYDRDCDGSSTHVAQPDCSDTDASVYPGAFELCDGKDNNCDGKYAPAKQACYARVGDSCRRGARVCKDAQGGGLEGDCLPGSTRVPQVMCEAYAGCSAKDPLACVNAIAEVTLSCTVEVDETTGALCDGHYDLPRPSYASKCRWIADGAESIHIKFKSSSAGPAPVLEQCSVDMVLLRGAGAPRAERGTIQFISNAGHAIFNVSLTPKKVAKCSDKPLVCKRLP